MAITRLQANGGGQTSFSWNATLLNPPTPGSYLIIYIQCRTTTLTVPSDFVQINGGASGANWFAVFAKRATGTEQTVGVSHSSSTATAWAYEEWLGVDPTTPVRATAGVDNTLAVTSVSSGATNSSPQIGDMAIGAFGTRGDISDQAFTNGYELDLNYKNAQTTVSELTTCRRELTVAGSAETTMSWTPSMVTRGLMQVLAFDPAFAATKKMNVYDGAQFVPGTPKVWDGAQWVEAAPKVWDGGAWVGG